MNRPGDREWQLFQDALVVRRSLWELFPAGLPEACHEQLECYIVEARGAYLEIFEEGRRQRTKKMPRLRAL